MNGAQRSEHRQRFAAAEFAQFVVGTPLRGRVGQVITAPGVPEWPVRLRMVDDGSVLEVSDPGLIIKVKRVERWIPVV